MATHMLLFLTHFFKCFLVYRCPTWGWRSGISQVELIGMILNRWHIKFSISWSIWYVWLLKEISIDYWYWCWSIGDKHEYHWCWIWERYWCWNIGDEYEYHWCWIWAMIIMVINDYKMIWLSCCMGAIMIWWCIGFWLIMKICIRNKWLIG